MQYHYTIRTMRRDEIDIAIDWALQEGWNPGLQDADCFYAGDPNGFLIGLLDDEPVATLSAVRYGDSFGFMGFYIVKPGHRGKGYGIKLWNAGLAYLEGRTIGLDGVVAQQDNYKKSGFAWAYNNVRYQGFGGGRFSMDSEIVNLSKVSFEALCAYDKAFFPDNRIAFLKCWIAKPQHSALGILQDGRLAGYGVVRPCFSGYKIGPLFADSPVLAERLFLALKTQASANDPVFMDVPAVNSAAVGLMQRHNMAVVFETARMYSGKKPDLPMNRWFGVTTFELG